MSIARRVLILWWFLTLSSSDLLAGPDLLVGSWSTHSIRRYDVDTGTFLGDFVPSGSGGLALPDGMDFGPDGDLYVSSSNSNQILRYDGTTGSFLDAITAQGLSAPGNLKFGPDNLLYVCNKNNGEVLRFDVSTGNLVDSFASGGGLQQPVGLLWDQGLLYVSDFTGNAIRRFDATNGAYVDDFAAVTTPLILNHDIDGKILVSSHQTSAIWRYDLDGTLLGSKLVGGSVNCPVGHLFTDSGDMIVASWQNNRLLRYDGATGAFVELFAFGDGLRLPNDLLLMPVPEPAEFSVVLGLVIGLMTVMGRRS